jgi:hypothetical protein
MTRNFSGLANTPYCRQTDIVCHFTHGQQHYRHRSLTSYKHFPIVTLSVPRADLYTTALSCSLTFICRKGLHCLVVQGVFYSVCRHNDRCGSQFGITPIWFNVTQYYSPASSRQGCCIAVLTVISYRVLVKWLLGRRVGVIVNAVIFSCLLQLSLACMM